VTGPLDLASSGSQLRERNGDSHDANNPEIFKRQKRKDNRMKMADIVILLHSKETNKL